VLLKLLFQDVWYRASKGPEVQYIKHFKTHPHLACRWWTLAVVVPTVKAEMIELFCRSKEAQASLLGEDRLLHSRIPDDG